MEDHEIVQLYLNRNEQAIRETSAKYGAYCTGIAMNILNSREDAEECVNDTYWKAWHVIPPHQPRILSAFLGKIVRNLSLNLWQRMHSAKRGGYEIAVILDELSEVVSGSESVEDSVMQKELIAAIDAFLHTLPEEKRRLFIRRYWYSESIGTIAEKCRRSENAVSAELGRIRKKLRNDLTERGYDI